ncbi:MAG TPA: hypothetical protein VEC19_20305 [Usitatibacter sp.]|nr:hypothetical protein [Usitatibacter sp.]
MRSLMLALAVLLVLPCLAQDGEAEQARRTIAAIEKLLEQRPGDATLYFYLSRFRSQLGDTRGAIAAMEKVHELGDGFLPSRRDFAKVWGDTGFQAVRSKLEAKLPRLDYAPTALELSDRTLLPEGIARDPASGSFYLGSFSGRVLKVTDGAAEEFAGAAAKMDAVLGLAIDGPRRILYAVSTSALTTAGQKQPRNAVVAFDLDTRRLLQRYDVPAAVQLNDVAVAIGGRVYASDSGSGAIYEIAVKGPGPSREVVPPNRIRGSNGLAPSPDGKRLYVGHSTGLAVVDLESRELKRVENPTRESVAGIDGLYQWQGQLVAVQSLTTPGRVILISLSGDGGAITKVQTLLSHHHSALAEPTTGVVGTDGFYLLAATGVSHFNREGRIEDPENVPNPLVLRIPLPR